MMNITITMEKQIDVFLASSDDTMTFPILTNDERKTIHDYCDKIGLFSQSEGPKNHRTLTIYKKELVNTVVEITDEDRKQLIKDFHLPIPVYKEPYFSYFIETLDPILKTKEKYALLVDAVTKLVKQGKKFKKYTAEMFDKISQSIAKLPIYQQFTKENGIYPCDDFPSETNIYQKTEKFPQFLFSLDIIKANYNCMKFHNKQMVLETESWDELVKKFTDIEYFVQAKYFRQIVFGKLNTKRISLIQKYLLTELYKKIKDHLSVRGRMGTDELFVKTTPETWEQDFILLKKLIGELPESMRDIWRITPFSLEPLGNSEVFVVKDLVDKTIEFKQVDKDIYIQAYKYLMKLPLEKNDLKAMKNLTYGDMMITYDEPFKFD